jgi:hypothetical protein
MIRTIISIEESEKDWLDRVSKSQRISMSELVRHAIKEFHERNKNLDRTDFIKLLNKTKGLWSEGDGLKFQRKLRDEWE